LTVTDDLGEHLLEDGPHPLGAEAVDRAVVEWPHAAYPQEPDVLARVIARLEWIPEA
jgi:hypothetical protein